MERNEARGRPRIGVVGLRRGLHMAEHCPRVGLEVVAACDLDPQCRAQAAPRLPGAAVAERWQDLLGTDLDGVILANDFDAHAEPAVAFLERGVHVLSETAACAGVEEGRRLIAAADASAATYSFAENFVFHPHVRLLRAAVESGEIGRPVLVEADYLHGMAPEAVDALVGDPAHWRGRIAATAYCTHTLSPVLAVTGARPLDVAAHTVDGDRPDSAAVLVVRLSTGALAVTRHGFLQGEPDSHWSWVSARGTRGLAESVRAPGERSWSLRVRTEAWAAPGGVPREEERTPPPLEIGGGVVPRADEGTVLVLEAFRATIADGAPPAVDVRAAVAASLVGVLGAESLAKGSAPVPVPDLGAAD
ncbi:Gfo/Idh/MocA family protein [Streptomonospora nanhaiensis]|uniref:Putative dehydrogenase n=1 Tax=Streptomonospora nanhaiensis TaxID=1323731 RepID=A0A853BN71_9ACTN|nr:Gfo/Idh/MocA family oxidoreductase [Streptomonospora nanhaiensis]MBV2364059.1 Gfo/Idh/MocA family oxidoreductase [Streptomonospora nanhaiensis]MBX9388657.1 Gfo/Idh/MocA family oxidoreductase [Streptomonospora nanhaiensis]NYI97059.1 putative dehydrogenase [Streptomonospora nanhaiensis]